MQRCWPSGHGFYPLLGFSPSRWPSGHAPHGQTANKEKNHGHTANQKNLTRVYFIVGQTANYKIKKNKKK